MVTFADVKMHEAWIALLDRLLQEGETVPSRAGGRSDAVKELMAEQLFVADLRDCALVSPDRRPNYRFMVAEWLWIMFGRNDVASIAQYNSRIRDFSDNGLAFYGAYGPHVADQMTDVLAKLKKDPATRQAVIDIWRNAPHPPTKDVPCTLSLQFLVRGGKLNVVASMRSSDAWLGVPYDAFNFMMVGNAVAGQLGFEPGSFILNMASSHLYERDWEAASVVVKNRGLASTIRAPRLPGLPPFALDSVLADPRFVALLSQPWAAYVAVLKTGLEPGTYSSLNAEAQRILEDANGEEAGAAA